MTPAQLAAYEVRLSARPRPLDEVSARIDLILAHGWPCLPLPTRRELAARWGWSEGRTQRFLAARRAALRREVAHE